MFLSSLLPPLLYLLLLNAMDVFSLIKRTTLVKAMAYGMAVALMVLAISRLYAAMAGAPWQAVWISPLIEEWLKAIPLLFVLAYTHRIAFQCEAMIYGAAVGVGFALTENVIYLYFFPSMPLFAALVRGFSTSLLHLGCTALTAATALLIQGEWNLITSKPHNLTTLKPQNIKTLKTSLALIPPVLLHTLHNAMLIDPLSQSFIVISAMLLMFYLIAQWSERSTVEWLDISITTHVELLSAFSTGQLSQTHAGQYLEKIKQRSHPELFFDIVVYMHLYMELLIEAKSRVMLHEVGMDEPMTDEHKELLKSKLTELYTLQQRIPALQRRLLHPILHYNQADRWAIDRLIED